MARHVELSSVAADATRIEEPLSTMVITIAELGARTTPP
jgi:hypothetical protein